MKRHWQIVEEEATTCLNSWLELFLFSFYIFCAGPQWKKF
uniref:Uncharacterized protein n=1 Tax=Arundo donax TaxID=35708 RepID=A0A0A8YZ74_ARUDO